MHVLPVPLTLVTAISTLRITVPEDLRPAETRKETLDTVKVGFAALLGDSACFRGYLQRKKAS